MARIRDLFAGNDKGVTNPPPVAPKHTDLAMVGLLLPYLTSIVSVVTSNMWPEIELFLIYATLIIGSLLWLPWALGRMTASDHKLYWVTFLAGALVVQFFCTRIFYFGVYFFFKG